MRAECGYQARPSLVVKSAALRKKEAKEKREEKRKGKGRLVLPLRSPALPRSMSKAIAATAGMASPKALFVACIPHCQPICASK